LVLLVIDQAHFLGTDLIVDPELLKGYGLLLGRLSAANNSSRTKKSRTAGPSAFTFALQNLFGRRLEVRDGTLLQRRKSYHRGLPL
jgi:hypothetical protein